MLKDYRESFGPLLADPEFQREFLSQLYADEGMPGLLEGLKEITAAQHRFADAAEAARVSRTTLYRSLSRSGNPSFRTVRAVLNELGLDFTVVSKRPTGILTPKSDDI